MHGQRRLLQPPLCLPLPVAAKASSAAHKEAVVTELVMADVWAVVESAAAELKALALSVAAVPMAGEKVAQMEGAADAVAGVVVEVAVAVAGSAT